MPVMMLQSVRCDVCTNNYRRKDMSVINGICAGCFESEYCFCIECGRILLQERSRCGGEWAQVYTGGALCCDCHYAQDHIYLWLPTPIDVSIATYKRIGSKRKFGVEIETSSCSGCEDLRGQTKFGCKTDPSISGREFDSPILYGDEGFQEIEDLLGYANDRNWYAGESCGCHTHYDMREETNVELYRVAYAYAKTHIFWLHCVSSDRGGSTYCGPPEYGCTDIRHEASNGTTFKNFCGHFDRYDYVNLSAYRAHGTFEVRLLEGTIDAETVCNWIAIHARFMDHVERLSFDDLDLLLSGDVHCVFDALIKIVGDPGLMAWLRGRIDNYNCSF